MKILVCGGRFYRDNAVLCATLDNAHATRPVTAIMHGCSEGADVRAGLWALGKGIPVEEYPALWHKYGNRAGPMRNRQMLDEGKPDLVIAFPGGRGTADMVRQARRRRTISVVEVTDQPALFGLAAASVRRQPYAA